MAGESRWPSRIQLTGSNCRRRAGSSRAEWYCPALEGGRCELTGDGKTRGGGGPGLLTDHGCVGGIAAVVADSGDPGRFPQPRGEGLCRAMPVTAGASCPLGTGVSSPLPSGSGLVTQRDTSLWGGGRGAKGAACRHHHGSGTEGAFHVPTSYSASGCKGDSECDEMEPLLPKNQVGR